MINRLRPQLARVRGATLFLQAAQDLRVGGRNSAALYQFTMRGDNLQDLTTIRPPHAGGSCGKFRSSPTSTAISRTAACNPWCTYDRDTAARFGISPQLIDNTLYDAFGQRQVSTMYTSLNQYHVVMEAAPRFWQDPEFLRQIYVRAPGGQQVPLNAFAHFGPAIAPLSVTHQGLFPAVTISFNLRPASRWAMRSMPSPKPRLSVGLPPTIQTMFAGTAQAYQDSLGSEPFLIAAALAAVYIVLGVLYESYIHPITILSTLPSAGVGALLALMLFNTDLSLIAMIGIILLIGIVKKNAIMMIDFALAAERRRRQESARRHLQSLPAALPPDSDDHHGGHAGRGAAGIRRRRGCGIAPPAGDHDHRRLDRQPVADALHDARRLPGTGQPSSQVGTRPQAPLG